MTMERAVADRLVGGGKEQARQQPGRAAVEIASLVLAGAIHHLCYPLAPVLEEEQSEETLEATESTGNSSTVLTPLPSTPDTVVHPDSVSFKTNT